MITTQKELRQVFRREFPELDFRKILDHSGRGRMFKCDTRCAFVFWVDGLNKDGQVSDRLAQNATL